MEYYDEETAEKLPKLLRRRKAHSFQTIKDINPIIFIAQIEDLNDACVKISHDYLLYFPR